MPRVIVAKLRLMEPKDIVDLAGKDLQYVYSALGKTPYQTEISKIPAEKLSSSSLEKACVENFMRTCKEIMDDSPKDIGFLLSSISKKFEANDVKAILRAKAAHLDLREAMRYITAMGKLDDRRCREILDSSKNLKDVVELLSDLEYGSALKEAMLGHGDAGALLPLEVAVDKYVYGEIWRAAGKLRGLDKKIARAVLGVEIDSMNIKVILRCKAMKISEEHIRSNLLPVSDVLGEKELEGAIRTTDMRSAVESLLAAARTAMARDYQYIMAELLEECEDSPSISRLERILDKGLLETSLRMLKRYTPFFNIGLILAFLNLKWFEVRNLRAIVKGAEEKVPADKIRELLVLAG